MSTIKDSVRSKKKTGVPLRKATKGIAVVDVVQKKTELPLHKARNGALAEVLFIFLPLIVISITLATKNNLLGIFSQAEWAFASTVLSGQAIVHSVLATTSKRQPQFTSNRKNNVIVLISAIIVFLLVPSLVVLTAILLLDTPPTFLVTLQMVLFGLSVLAFYYCRMASEYLN